MIPLDAFHLPGLSDDDVVEWNTRTFGEHVLRVPVLGPAVLGRIGRELRAARERTLEARSPRAIAALIEAAADRMLAGERGALTERALVELTGYSLDMVRHVLERMHTEWQRSGLERLLDAELDGGRALDAFVRQPARSVRSRAFGPALAVHFFAGNVPGVAVTALARSLLVRSAVLGKTASGEPWLAASFAQALAEIDAEAGHCIAITHWPGEDEALRDAALAEADAVIVYGGEAAARAVRANAPAGVRVIEHGPRYSIGLVGREVLAGPAARRTAADVATAVATFDQQGCVSPHAVWIEEGGAVAPREFAALVADQLERIGVRLARGRTSAAQAAAIHEARTIAEFRAIGGEDVDVWSGGGTDWTVIWDATGEFVPSPLGRTLRICPAPSLDDAIGRIEPYRAFLQTVAVEAPAERIAALAPRLARAGATRITGFATAPWPPVDGHHDGRGPLRELCHWVDLEEAGPAHGLPGQGEGR